ncbi:MAG: hypothetical protein E6Q88_07275 [Lysobacteraceae bacterium]|nr:MAG: hypothetical protein E6Q88_07275 [Xanthomonadaceae bacterium]
MSRTLFVFASALLLLTACQRENAADPAAATDSPDLATTAHQSNDPEASAPAPSSASVAPVAVESFGIESCDSFVAAINQCFATAKAHPSVVQMLRATHEQEFARWRRMKEEPAMAKMLDKVCQTQLRVIVETKKGLNCS